MGVFPHTISQAWFPMSSGDLLCFHALAWAGMGRTACPSVPHPTFLLPEKGMITRVPISVSVSVFPTGGCRRCMRQDFDTRTPASVVKKKSGLWHLLRQQTSKSDISWGHFYLPTLTLHTITISCLLWRPCLLSLERRALFYFVAFC